MVNIFALLRKKENVMSDLIERQKAVDAVLNLSEKVADEMLFIDAIVDEIENLPSAEPERTAKVETVEKPNVYKCSECGQYFHSTAWGSPVEYCSRCGARLEWK